MFLYAAQPEQEGVEMQFRLVYRGPLPAQSNSEGRLREKHHIRRVLHAQLRQLWSTQSGLKGLVSPPPPPKAPNVGLSIHFKIGPTFVENTANRFARCGYRFVPLIGDIFGEARSTACALDILFLRRDGPGNLVRSGGDIDNRIKVLFDALRMPQDCNEVRGLTPEADEDPFFCLLQDDQLITEVKITTDRLLTPMEDAERVNDVHLVIHVRTQMTGTGAGVAALI